MINITLPQNLNYLSPFVVGNLTRVGRDFDGGYILPDDVIPKSDCLISMGLSNDWSFEIECKRINPRIEIHAFDFSISKKKFIKKAFSGIFRLITLSHSYEKTKERISVLFSYLRFFKKDVRHHQNRIYSRVDSPVDITIDMVFSKTNASNILLKMDIEGSEYRVIDDVLTHSSRVSCMAIEFHDTQPFRSVFEEKIKKIQEKYSIVHLHANNCAGIGVDGLPEVLEITFLRNELLNSESHRSLLPLDKLDMQNSKYVDDFEIKFSL